MEALRLIVYDATDVAAAPLAIPRVERAADGTASGTGGLTRFWRLGAGLHKGVARRAHATLAASTWEEALAWATDLARTRGARIAELQAWGHGGWGHMRMGDTRIDERALVRNAPLARELDAFRDVLAPDALVWLRCCSAFGHHEGRAFATSLADRLGARVAGHTFIIGVFQSGTHSIAAGEAASWDAHEGVEVAGGMACAAKLSSRTAPRTLTCFRLGLPAGW